MSTFTVFAQLQEAPKPSWWAAARHSGPVAAAVASMVMVAFLGAASSRASAPPGQDRQPLTARRLAAGEIELQWNAHDPQLTSADEGILTIIDGGNERSEYLGVDAIQRGSYRYQRQSWDVWFCLRLFHNGRRLSMEDVRLFDSAADAADAVDSEFAPPASGETYIQVAAVPKRDAERLGKALAAQHLPVAYDPVLGGTDWYRVLVGPVRSDSELPGRLAEIRQTGLVEGAPFARKF